MLPADSLRHVARRLTGSADRLTALTHGVARHAADVEWECPRGRRAVERAGELAARARADADRLHTAARDLRRAADERA
jgi:hypothetical protein